MRGLTADEWCILEGSVLPDPCDDETECEYLTPEEEAAEASLTDRGLVVSVACVYDSTDEHPGATAAGRLLFRLGREAVVRS